MSNKEELAHTSPAGLLKRIESIVLFAIAIVLAILAVLLLFLEYSNPDQFRNSRYDPRPGHRNSGQRAAGDDDNGDRLHGHYLARVAYAAG